MSTAKDLDKKYKDVLETIKKYPDQLKQAWDEINLYDISHDYSHINKVAICGMGGSALGGRIVDSLMINRVRVPIEIFNQYHIPNYSDDRTLIIAYSYSGNTEEVVSALHEAITRDTKIFAVTTGGKVKDIVYEHSIPAYIIDPKNNPSGQPRMALGYAVGAILALFSKLELANVTNNEVYGAIDVMHKMFEEYGEEAPSGDNLAVLFAEKLSDKAIALVASEHLYGTAYSIKNQLNETAKTFSTVFELPELNHHLLEGLKHPVSLKKDLAFLFFNSKLYSDRVQKRYPLTEKVIEKNDISSFSYTPRSETKTNQVFETFVFGSMLVYFLAKSKKIDPTSIPWVDYFKEQLSKS